MLFKLYLSFETKLEINGLMNQLLRKFTNFKISEFRKTLKNCHYRFLFRLYLYMLISSTSIQTTCNDFKPFEAFKIFLTVA